MWKILVFIVSLVSARNVKRDYNEGSIVETNSDYGASYRSVVPTTDLFSEAVIVNDPGFRRQNVYTNINRDIHEDVAIRDVAPIHVEPRHIDRQYRQNKVPTNHEYVNMKPEPTLKNQEREGADFDAGRERTRFYETSQVNGQTLNNRDPYQNAQRRNQYGNGEQQNSDYREENVRTIDDGNQANAHTIQNNNQRKLLPNANSHNQGAGNGYRKNDRSTNETTSMNTQTLNNNRKSYEIHDMKQNTEQSEYVQSDRPTKPQTTTNCGNSPSFNNACYEQLRQSQNSRQGSPCFEGKNDLVCIEKNCSSKPHEQRFYKELRVYSHQHKLVICFDNSCFDKDCKPVHADITNAESTNNNHDTHANDFRNSNTGQNTDQTQNNKRDENINRHEQHYGDNGDKTGQDRTGQANVNEKYRPTNMFNPGKNTNEESKPSDRQDDKWIWDMAETITTEAPTSVTPGLDDRAAFTGDKCATGKIKVNNVCVEKDR